MSDISVEEKNISLPNEDNTVEEIIVENSEVVETVIDDKKFQKAQDKLNDNLAEAEVMISKRYKVSRKALNKGKNDSLCIRNKETGGYMVVGPYTPELEKILNDIKLKYFPKKKPTVIVVTEKEAPAEGPKIEPIISKKVKGAVQSTGVIKENIKYVEFELGLIQELGREVKMALEGVVTLDVDAKKDFRKAAASYMSIISSMMKLKLDAKILADKDVALVIAKQVVSELQTYILQLKRMNDILMTTLCNDCRQKAMWTMVTSLPQEELAKITEDEEFKKTSNLGGA